MIRLDNISYGYTKKNNILNEISFTIKDGDCLAVLGHNGSGKTTLAYLIIGLLKQQTGNIYNQFSKIAYLPEHGGTYKNLSVINNLKFKAKLEGIAQDSYIIENYLQDFGLESSKHKLVLHLSQGLEKRLALAMFFLTNCQLLYLDEPTNTLAPEMIIKLKQRVNSLRESGKTLIINSHNLTFVQEVCTDILILQNGNICFYQKNKEVEIEELYMDLVGDKNEK